MNWAAEFFGPPDPPDSAQEHGVGMGSWQIASLVLCASIGGLHRSPVGSREPALDAVTLHRAAGAALGRW